MHVSCDLSDLKSTCMKTHFLQYACQNQGSDQRFTPRSFTCGEDWILFTVVKSNISIMKTRPNSQGDILSRRLYQACFRRHTFHVPNLINKLGTLEERHMNRLNMAEFGAATSSTQVRQSLSHYATLEKHWSDIDSYTAPLMLAVLVSLQCRI